jgi:hypothetical protein
MRHPIARITLLAITAVIAMSSSAFAQTNEVRIIEVPGAPLEITSYAAEYRERGTYTTEGIHHSVTVRNVSQQEIVAISIGFNAFDAFKRYMGRPLNGVDIAPIAVAETTGRMTWTQTPSASFTFARYGIGVAYVRLVRLADGTIWEADMDYVLDQLQQIEDGLTLADLDETP